MISTLPGGRKKALSCVKIIQAKLKFVATHKQRGCRPFPLPIDELVVPSDIVIVVVVVLVVVTEQQVGQGGHGHRGGGSASTI